MALPEIDLVLMSLAVFAVSTLLALVARGLLLRVLQQWVARTESRTDDTFLAGVRRPSIAWAIAIGLYLAIGTSELPQRYVTLSFKLIHVLLILSITLVLAGLSAQLTRYSIRRAGMQVPVTGLSQAVVKGFILLTGAMILLGTLGIAITPLITALGIGGLAVALGLQDTLSNLFSGMHLLMEQPVRVGDFIRLESGQEGYVTDIGWRTTRIRMLQNNLVIIPNSKLAQSVVMNYSLPTTEMALLLQISVNYNTDPDRVEQLLLEEAGQVARETPGLLADPAPFVRLIPGFGPSSLDFTLICQVREVTDQYLVQHELRKRILRRFRAEGIEISPPVRTLQLQPQAGQGAITPPRAPQR